jgi:hypothetical protein
MAGQRGHPGMRAGCYAVRCFDTQGAGMERKRINSSRIRSAGYDPKAQVLEIEFSDGKIVSYRGVSPEVHRQFANAPSPVSFYEDKIAENYPETRVR